MAKSVNNTNLKWEELQTLHCFIHPSIFIITITIADKTAGTHQGKCERFHLLPTAAMPPRGRLASLMHRPLQ